YRNIVLVPSSLVVILKNLLIVMSLPAVSPPFDGAKIEHSHGTRKPRPHHNVFWRYHNAVPRHHADALLQTPLFHAIL
ncbi:hypothetical protein LI045_27260, partial [Bacteroides thetaiotaomicron]|uniref:hypothetical protein n=1 Tax=Bacteroides thetaiotaomicron TaxID=818 RepID=UPI001D0786EE